ncbi:MAG: hypothetical protein QOI26_2597, partial [Pseudonocardiales bacterium]|nr:hypothetical protein [Pseudonocardiales bacterium]
MPINTTKDPGSIPGTSTITGLFQPWNGKIYPS